MADLNAKFPVMLTFDLDGETLWLSRDPKSAHEPVQMSMGRYGPVVAIPRILELLERHDIKATFFVPAWIAEKYPDMTRRLVEEGHEVGHHGDVHEWLIDTDRETEERILARGIKVLEEVTGQRPAGWRAPAWVLTPHSIELLSQHGFLYSSNLHDADGPYRHELDGNPLRLIELPVEWQLCDTSFYLYYLPIPVSVLMTNNDVLSVWRDEFDGLLNVGQSFVLTLHPQFSGRPNRLALLDAFIQHVKTASDAVFARCIDVATQFDAELPLGGDSVTESAPTSR